jgi:protein-S-isoprenylcysteine O-methyltransferase Ste14
LTVCFSWFDMLKLPPPIWTLIYIVLSSALSRSLGWPTIPGLPLPLLGIVLVALAFVPPVWAFILFRREDTEINRTSQANRKLVTRGPYQFTHNPMYLGLAAPGYRVRFDAELPRPPFRPRPARSRVAHQQS